MAVLQQPLVFKNLDSAMRFTPSEFRKFSPRVSKLSDLTLMLEGAAEADPALQLKMLRTLIIRMAACGMSDEVVQASMQAVRALTNMACLVPKEDLSFVVYKDPYVRVDFPVDMQFHPAMGLAFVGVEATIAGIMSVKPALPSTRYMLAESLSELAVEIMVSSREFNAPVALCLAGFAGMEAARLHIEHDGRVNNHVLELFSFFDFMRTTGGTALSNFSRDARA